MVGLTTVSGDLHVTGFGTFLGLTVTGIATYEDVRHVDALGLSTFREGLESNTVSGVSTFYRGTNLAVNTGQVSIGTAVPSGAAELTVRGDNPELALVANAQFSSFLLMGDTADPDNGMIEYDNTNSNKRMRFIVNADEKMRIDNSGNLGIGTNNPSQILHIQKDSSHQILLKRGGVAPSECTFQNDGNLLKITNNVNGIEFKVGSGSLETAMYIEDGGNVAISTANPDKTLTVDGTARLNVADLGNVSGNVTLNFNTNNNYVMTLTGTTQFLAPTGIATGQSGVIVLKQDGTGSRTATWDSSFKFKGGTAPTLSTGAGKSDAVAYFCHEPPYIIAGTFIGIGSA